MIDRVPEDLIKSRNRESEQPEFLPCCDDAKVYLDFFRSTREYREIVKERTRIAEDRVRRLMETGKIDSYDPPSEEEVQALFEAEGSEEFKQFFWNFYEDVVHLKYDPEKNFPEFQKAFIDYQTAAKKELREAKKSKNVGDLESVDYDRSFAHNKAAEVLVKNGMAPNNFIGRILVRAFLVDKRLDYIASARQADIARTVRGFSDREAQIRYLSESKIEMPRFSLDRIRELQNQFMEGHPKIPPECKREDYESLDSQKVYALDGDSSGG